MARLEQGPLTGSRITRHGYLYRFREVKGCSHRGFKSSLEETRGEDGIGTVHLCAAVPCTLPACDRPMVHIGS